MIKTVAELLRLLTHKQKIELLTLQLLVVVMSIAELVGIASIGPFMALIGNIGIIEQNGYLREAYRLSGLSSPQDFIFWAGIVTMLMLTCSALVSIFTLWKLSIFGHKVGIELGNRLYRHYLHQPWLFHASAHSALLGKKIATDTSSVTAGIIQPLLQINARMVLAVFIAIPVLIFNPAVAIITLLVFIVSYLVIYRLVRQQLEKNGRNISAAYSERYALVSEGLGGIKDVLLLGRQKNFVQRFQACGAKIFRGMGTNQTITQAPRYLMEVVAFGGVIMLVLFLLKTYNGNLGAILPTLAVYALAGFKLLPSFQNIYHGVSSIKAYTPSFEAIKADLQASQNPSVIDHPDSTAAVLERLNQGLELRNISFTYPGKTIPALDHLTMLIPARKVVGIVGATGSGKSTLIDIVLGLIQPDQGSLLIDGQALGPEQMRSWQNCLGAVSQSIYLANASILENVAFGLRVDEIDVGRAMRAMQKAHLEELIKQLPEGMHTVVGERGIQLSGGQRQRIGIARALYHDAEVLVLDEATSALDGITENFIMQAIQDFSGEKTIIMIAHRFATIQKCDIIYFMEAGCVVDKGTYNELLERNRVFRNMAGAA